MKHTYRNNMRTGMHKRVKKDQRLKFLISYSVVTKNGRC